MIVTTSSRAGADVTAQAQQLSTELGGRYIARGQHSLQRMRRRFGERGILVLSERELRYEDGEESLYFHPSMANIRVKRLMKGETDPMITASGCQTGDAILDCTAGLASDSVVFAYAAGDQGSVTALESQPLLCAIIRDGLRRYESGVPELDQALRRIEVRCADHLETLSSLPDDSYDIVYFDPMFRRPLRQSSAIDPLRQLANPEAVSSAAIREACRVARRCVVLKEHERSGEFERLGFGQLFVQASNLAYGVIHT
ncbi:class I SAM-dependent methyltransferase [Paenibacillus sp. 1P07SE]|uniref:class I SAM-dependent methyltransferase n=1 Tax=Paenibacillus sp. 1P07SE TaxID=3132209 RepID=UPI0039A63BD9